MIYLYLHRLIRLAVSIIWTKAKLFSIMPWLVYEHIHHFCNLKLNYNLVVCGMPNLIKLCYFLAYKEHYSIHSSI